MGKAQRPTEKCTLQAYGNGNGASYDIGKDMVCSHMKV